MKKVFSLLFSSKTTLILLLIFTVSIAVATFVEDKYDTTTAQLLIYRAWWFELIIGLIVLNYIGQLRHYNFFSKGKFGGLLFHTGFIVLVIGAAVTRYFGDEGSMHIREGESSNTITGIDPYLQVKVSGPKGDFSEEHPVQISGLGGNDFSYKIKSGYDKPVTVSFNRFIKNAEDTVNENVPDGADMLALQISSDGTNQGVYLKKGERINRGGIFISFADTLNDSDVIITQEGGKLLARAKTAIAGVDMASGKADTTQKGTLVEFREKNVFQYKNVLFTLVKLYKNAQLDFKKGEDDGHDHGINMLTINAGYNGQVQRVNLTASSDPNDQPQELTFGDLKVSVKYGVKEIKLPFSVKLNDFILDRYAGSTSPSSFASEVTVIDPGQNSTYNKRIFMNNVLDHKGYRFFQSSYDTDEKGTILSVNSDFWGTWISYASYLLLMIGFTITMFTKNSRYHLLTVVIRKLRDKRKTFLLVFAIMLGGNFTQAQPVKSHVVDRKEAEKLGMVLVQTFDGRLEPVHTLAYEVMHKISKKDEFSFEGKEHLDAMQVMIDVIADPEYWKQQKIIYVKESSVANILGVDGKYASFNDFINGGEYKLAALVETSFQKSPAQQNRFDRELIKVDERLNLYYMLLQGSLLKILPENNSSDKWVDWTDSLARKPLTGTLTLINNDLKLKEFNYSNILGAYFQALMTGAHSGDYSNADRILGYIKNIQTNNIDSKNFPSEQKIRTEIQYNKSKIFNNLNIYYGLISLFLIIFAFTDNLKSKPAKWLWWAQRIGIALLAATFLYHTYGMILRWYISGHAPWSNGYETLLLIAWSTVLAGFFYINNSKIIQAATAFLACIILMVAGLSNYDPQLTNLQPVLKSYWLIIHVAVITIGYGFLALGFILGFIDMFLYLFKSQKNSNKMDSLITELTFINEKNLQIGLFLVTLGTFLGGVWASESWGRYWGWDAKETWALIIVIVYSIILHLRLVPKLRGSYIFNVSSIIGFGSVLMTFIGVNYFFSKGLHSYASDEKTIFPLWAWILIFSFIILMVVAGIKEKMVNKNNDSYNKPQQ
jgi:cytochrome c-type biogenesis protein CcsB